MPSSRHALLRAALVGSALGSLWGVLARVWMRLISTTPEFSWMGSFFIVVLGAVFGGCVGVAAEARRQRRSRWWRLAAVPALILFAGQGMAFLPGALAMGVEYRACVDADPLLPRELLPQPWTGRAARELLVRSRRLALRLREAGGRPALFATYHDLVDALPGSGTAPGEGADGRQTRGGDT